MFERFSRRAVPLDIPLQLRFPVLAISDGDRRMQGAPVPEAAVDEDRQPHTRERHVDFSPTVRRVNGEIDSIAITGGME